MTFSPTSVCHSSRRAWALASVLAFGVLWSAACSSDNPSVAGTPATGGSGGADASAGAAGSGAGVGGSAAGSGGTAGSGGGVGGGCSNSDQNLIDSCIATATSCEAVGVCNCQNCACELADCAANQGCTDIRNCAQEKGCVGIACASKANCLDVVLQYGGITAEPSKLALALSGCVEDTMCPTTCNDLDAGDGGETDAGDLDAGDLDAGDLDAGDLDAGDGGDANLDDAGTSDAGDGGAIDGGGLDAAIDAALDAATDGG